MSNSILDLSPQVKVVTGYNNSVIYDFKNEKAYRVSKLVGKLLGERNFDKLPTEVIEKLRKIGILTIKRKDARAFSKIAACTFDSPTFCILELTSRCNFHCPHCYLGTKSTPQELGFSTVHDLLGQIQKMGIKKIHLTGGEICLRNDLIRILQLAHDQGFEIWMSTNGSLISESLTKAVEKYVSKIQVTLYALSAKEYSRFSGSAGAFRKVISAIDKLKERCSDKLLVTFTVTPYNYQELNLFREFVGERRLESTIGMTMPIGLASDDKNLVSEPYKSFISSLFEEFDKEGRCKVATHFRKRVCKLDQITILSNGSVTICPLSRWLSFGSIYDYKLSKLWSKKVRPFFRSLDVDRIEICKECEYKYLCGGECPALWPLLEPIKMLKNPPCEAFFSTRRFKFIAL